MLIGYCWLLCDKIAKELSKESVITKEAIYKDAIKQIGSFEPMIIEEKAYENFKRIWEKQGLGFLVNEVSRKDKCIKVHCYYGSSTYDSKEMSLLISLLVELAESLNIETKSQQEINSLLESWNKNEKIKKRIDRNYKRARKENERFKKSLRNLHHNRKRT